jgi:hypothetical protein
MANVELQRATAEFARLQFVPPSVVLTNPSEVAAYKILEFRRSIATSEINVAVSPDLTAVQVIPLSVLLNTPALVPA